jgi:hypothetical protein
VIDKRAFQIVTSSWDTNQGGAPWAVSSPPLSARLCNIRYSSDLKYNQNSPDLKDIVIAQKADLSYYFIEAFSKVL